MFMADVDARIGLSIDTTSAISDLRRLQSEISLFNKSLASANTASAASATALNRALMDGINSTRMFDARMVPVISTVDSFSNALEKNKLTLGEYTRYAASQLPGLSRIFRDEFRNVDRLARDRLKSINAQYLEFGKTARGVREALQITPTGLASGAATELALATQRQQIFNKLIDDGSTKLLNWGKNTQWAGRQLMVGFTLPLAALGTAAAQAFMEIDKATVAFERVYGDLSTTTAEMERNKTAVMELGAEYTKYGIAVSDTIQLSARVAATGLQNNDMITATEQSLRFATLGQIDYNQALDATIALQSAFNVSSKDLGSTIDYLNAVENQTILSIEDMSAAIPRVATVIQGLGGDVRDLAIFMTAMREGGVSAENAANALKSGLASLINPTKRAQESMQKLGIDMQAIINTNRGDLLATVSAFGQALSKVDEFSRTQALEQIFGKYQYARMAALFDNIAKSSSQAARAMDLANMSVAELATLSEKELSKIEESTTVKFEAAMERLKLSIAPLGEAFLKGIMPIMDALTSIAEAFNKLPDPVKSAIAVITGVVAGLGPVFLMTIGLIGNGLANLIKGIQFFRKRIAGIRGDADNFEFLAKSELEAKTASEQLEGSVTTLTGALGIQSRAVAALIRQYERYAVAAGITSATVASRGRRGAAPSSAPPLAMARGGVVPGSGSGDKIPALLEPGETVVTKKASQRYGPVIAAMNAGTLRGYQDGLNLPGVTIPSGASFRKGSSQSIEDFFDSVKDMAGASDAATRVLQRLADDGGKITAKAFKDAMIAEGLVPQRTPRGQGTQRAHLTERRDYLTESGIEFLASKPGDSPEGRSLPAQRILDALESDPNLQRFMREYSGLTADLPGRLNRELATGTATFADFNSAWSQQGSRLSASLAKFGGYVDDGSGQLQRFEADLLERIRQRTGGADDALVSDQMLAEETRLLIADYKNAGGSMRMVGEAAERAATTIAQVSLDLSTVEGRQYMDTLRSQGMLIEENGNFYYGNAQEYAASGNDKSKRGAFLARNSGTTWRAGERVGELATSSEVSRRVSQRVAREATNLVDDASDAIDAALERNSPAERVARAGDDMDRGLAEGIRRSASIPVAAARDVADDTAKAMDPQTAFKQSQGEQRRMLRQIDLIPQTRARLKQEAMREAAIGGGDRRQQIRAARRRVEEMSDEQILAIIQQEESQRIAREKQVSAERRAIRSKADSDIARARNSEAVAESRAAKARTTAANLRAQQSLEDIAAEAAAGQAYDLNTRQQVQGRRGIASRIGGALMRRSGTIGMGLGMASMIPFMAQNDQGQFMGMNANALGMGMAATGMAFDMASLVKLGPIMGIATKAAGALGLSLGGLAAATGGVTLAVGAAVVAYKLWRDSVDNANRAAADLGANLGGTANALNNISKILGKMTPAQSRTQLQLGITSEQMNEEMAQWANMLSEGAGKEFIDELKGATSEERFQKLADYIRYGIASGAMDITQARQFADAVALQLDDALLSIRVKSAIANQQTGTNAMLALARGREKALLQSEALNQVNLVLEPGNGFSNTEATNASQVVAGSLQVVQDFANASAIAAAELASGKISQTEYEQAVKDSNDAIKTSTENMIKAMRATDDLGGTMAAFNDQLVKLGMTAEQAASISEMTGLGITLGGAGGRAGGIRTTVSQEQVRAEAGMAAAQGVSFENIQAIYDYMKSEEGRNIANVFGRLAGTGQAYSAAGLQMSMEQGGIPGLLGATEAETKQNIERTMEVAIKFIEIGGTAADFQQFIMSIPPEKVIAIQAKYIDPVTGQVTNPEALKREIDSFNKLLPSLGAQQAFAVTERQGGDVSQETIDAAATLKKVFGDNQEAIDRYINIALNTDPEGLEKYLPEITEQLDDLNTKIPPDIQKVIGINLENEEDVAKYGPMADALALLVPILQSLPTDQQTFAAQFVFSAEENGEPVDPITFGRNVVQYQKTLDKLRSSKKSVRKEAAVDLVVQAYDAQGKPIDPAQAQDAVNYMIEELGITEAEFLQLPPDKISKIIEFMVEAKGLEEAAATYSALAAASFAAGDNEAGRQYQAAANRMSAAAATAKANATGAVGEGLVQGGNELTGGGGGGGGGAENPIKQANKGFLQMIKMYADLNATMDKVNDARYNLVEKFRAGQGIIDQLRRIGLNEGFISQLAEQGYDALKAAQKRFSGGRGVAEQNRLVVRSSIAQTLGERRTGMVQAQNRARAATRLRGMGVGESAITSMIDNPVLAASIARLGEKGAMTQKELNKLVNEIIRLDEKSKNAADAVDPLATAIEKIGVARAAIEASIQETEARLADTSEQDFVRNYGITKDQAQLTIMQNEQIIEGFQKQIDEKNELIKKDERQIALLERAKKLEQDKIDKIQAQVDAKQKTIEKFQRENDVRSQQADIINHSLDVMSQKEDDIRNAYEKRLKALDEIASVNDYILRQQQGQLDYADALTRGDIAGAAKARAQMEAEGASYAVEQMRTGLQTGMENQIASLTTEGGLTREQAEKQLQAINEQNYQNNLLIVGLQNEIYDLQQQMLPYKDQIAAYDKQIAGYNESIYQNQEKIYEIQTKSIDPLINQNKELQTRLDNSARQLEIDTLSATLNDKQALRQLALDEAHYAALKANNDATDRLGDSWQRVANWIAEANRLLRERTSDINKGDWNKLGSLAQFDKGGKFDAARTQVAITQDYLASIRQAMDTLGYTFSPTAPVKKYAGGFIGIGAGSRDSVSAMLTPGEYVIRKASVNKYGKAMLDSINMGSFSLPRYDAAPTEYAVQGSSNTSVVAPVYNTYSVNVNVPNTNADPDVIANKVMMRISQVEGSNIRRLRGN